MTKEHQSILVVDDDANILRLICDILQKNEYQVHTALDGETALDLFVKKGPNLVLLDIMMPGIDGFEICEKIRHFSPVPIIMVTAKGDDNEKVKGLGLGADDYITKPFSSRELIARVRAALRRPGLIKEKSENRFTCYDLIIDYAQHKVTVAGNVLNLTALEFDLLACLAHNAGQIVTYDEILLTLWGDGQLHNRHLLQTNINRIRRKLSEKHARHKYIITKHEIGYFMITES